MNTLILGPIAMAQKPRNHDRLISLIWSFLITAAAWTLWADRRGPMSLADVLVGFGIACGVTALIALWGRK